MLDLANTLLELVDALSRIIRVRVRIWRTKVPPLEAVDRSKVSLAAVAKPARLEELLGAVAVPDLVTCHGDLFGVSASAQKPEQLHGYSVKQGALGSEK